MKKETYNITGMSCAACQAAVTRAVEKLEGTENVNVNLMQNKMTVELSDGVTDEMIIKAVTDAGYGANVLRKEKNAGKVNSTNCTYPVTFGYSYYFYRKKIFYKRYKASY